MALKLETENTDILDGSTACWVGRGSELMSTGRAKVNYYLKTILEVLPWSDPFPSKNYVLLKFIGS
jgi:hypothetical protein